MKSMLTLTNGLLALATVSLVPSEAGAQTFCTPTADPSLEYISRVQIATIDKISGTGVSGYSDFTTTSTSLAAGSASQISLTPGFPNSAFPEQWRVAVDLNRNGSFDDVGETLVTGTTTGATPLISQLTIPASTVTGAARMRVQMRYGTTPASCGNNVYGETEDYTLNITGASNPGGGGVTNDLSTIIQFSSPPGEYIGQGQNRSFALAEYPFTIYGGDKKSAEITVSSGSNFWSFNLVAPTGDILRPGVYTNAERAKLQSGRAPGLNITSPGRGCNSVYGSFIIEDIAFNAAGRISMLDASFVQQCESPTAPSLIGTIKFNALPLSFSYGSDAGDYIGQGKSQSYTNSTSLISLTNPYGNTLNLRVSGKRDEWSATFSPPTGQQWKVGTYTTKRFADTTSAGLDFGGNGRGCNTSSGTLTINGITTDSGGKIVALNATFGQSCSGSTGGLKGTLRYNK